MRQPTTCKALPLVWLLAASLFLAGGTALAQPADEQEGQPTDEVPAEPDDKPAPDKPAPAKPPPDKPPPGDKPAPGTPGDVPVKPEPEPAKLPLTPKEDNCTDRIDNDGDSVVDCGDADCTGRPECAPTGVREQTDQLCSDWIDNDGDGAMDCDDKDCVAGGVSVCRGAYKGPLAPGTDKTAPRFHLPPLDEGVTVDEVIGKLGDKDGERNDYVCSDGVDNDGDGRVDCADFGCRFDSQVTVCNPQPGFRFSVVAQVEQLFRLEDTNASEFDQNDFDTRFSLLQLRFMGPIGNLEDSFFLLSMRADKTFRATFAMFILPLGDMGHYVNVNSGGGGLTHQLIISGSKHLLLEPAYFVYNAFEQGNGAAIEIGGPIDSGGRVNFRVFGAGGSGRYAGNIGGRYFSGDQTNYTWAAGAQMHFNIAGHMGRFESPYIYTPENLKIALIVGGKYDQRDQERYPAWNGTGMMKWWHFYLMGETYWKREIEFRSWQYSYLVQLGALLWPKHLLLAADFGEYIAGDLECVDDGDCAGTIATEAGSDIKKQKDERQFRAALHWYAYEKTGIVSARYTYHDVKSGRFEADGYREQELSLMATYRF